MFARPSALTAMASAPQISFAPLAPKRCQRRFISSEIPPVVVPSQPSMGWMAMLLPMVFPLIMHRVIGCKSGLPGPASMESSKGRSAPTAAQWVRKSATVLRDATRVSLKGVLMAQRSASIRRARSARISRSDSGRLAERGWVSSHPIQPRSFRNIAAECLYAGTGGRKARKPRY